MESDEYEGLMKFSRRIAIALKKAIPCKRVGMAVVGLEVPHAHVHLIPLNHMDEMRFSHKVRLTPEEFQQVVEAIREHL
jgi:histidine triad (HIT) family protein